MALGGYGGHDFFVHEHSRKKSRPAQQIGREASQFAAKA